MWLLVSGTLKRLVDEIDEDAEILDDWRKRLSEL
jgi:hypothetical protein